ncbi:MAG: hypothetical protein MUE57_08980 [Syntrophales bacterium]|jgi:hypothetical protein|nr:hypothetical protein [Syntrophales bacterium]MCU0553458.1 hypothetical protein [Syntrophales bacterium]MCU0583958.1 hypothetical protein [Syntrophales bacterium]
MTPGLSDAAPRAESRDADAEFLEYLGTFEAEGADAMDPLVLEALEAEKAGKEKAKKAKAAKNKRRVPADEKTSQKDTSDE